MKAKQPLKQLLLILATLLAAPTLLATEPALRLTLPAQVPAVVGVPASIYFDNIVLTQTPEAYRFDVACDLGKSEPRRWTLTPKATDLGTHPLSITVTDASGKQLAKATTRLRVVPADAGEGQSLRLLIVGDSLTHATLYPNEIARLLARPGNPEWTLLGTHKPTSAKPGVAHEGYGGWTWQRFVQQYEPNPDGTYRKRSSPFVYLGKDEKPALDVPRYIREECNGKAPDVVLFLLGINDCFSANPEDAKAIDARIDVMMSHADTLLAAFHKAAPEAELAVGITTPGNARESGFFANYKGRYKRWGWKRIQHRLVERLIERFAGREKERLFLVPTQLNLDPVDGYPDNNGVHPNAVGYAQIGASMYAWLKWRLQERAALTE